MRQRVLCGSRGLILFGFLVLGPFLFGQQETGSITGAILDPSGGVVPGAQVTIQNQSTMTSFDCTSDAAGFYSGPQLAPGIYTITVKATGFKAAVRANVEVRVADRLRVDFDLQVGAVTQTVEVTGAAPLLQTQGAAAGEVIDTQRTVDLPLNGRDWLQLATLAPATVNYPGVIDTSGGNILNVVFNLGGGITNQQTYLLNGMDTTMFVSAGGAIVYPPVDSIQEFKVETNNYSADTGRLSGAVVNANIKSGSNAVHGTAYEFLRNNVLNGRNVFAESGAKPEYTRNQFGASVGGPLIKNKLFFFSNYEGSRYREASVASTEVFTAAQKNGDFSSQLGTTVLGTDDLGRPVLQGQVFNPFTVRQVTAGQVDPTTGLMATASGYVRDAYAGNIITNINPVSQKLINLVPAPNASGSPNYILPLSIPLNIDTGVLRIDWTKSEHDTIDAYFIGANQYSYTPPILGLPLDGGNAQNNLVANQRMIGVGWTHIFRPTDLNELRVGFVRNTSLRSSVQGDVDLNGEFGIPFPYNGPSWGGMAAQWISGYTAIGTSAYDPFDQYVSKAELADTYTAIRGAHSLKFGFWGARHNFYNQHNCGECRGLEMFTGVYTQQPGFGGSGTPLGDYLSGTVDYAEVHTPINELDVGRDYEAFAVDAWQVSRKLNVTLGVRYQDAPPSWNRDDKISNVVWGPGFSNVQVDVPAGMSNQLFQEMQNVWFPFVPVVRATNLGRGLTRTVHDTFAPRLGIAYQLQPRTVLRAGYGWFWGFPEVVSGAVLTVSPPLQLTVSQGADNIHPNMLINQAIFGTNPFDQALVDPSYLSVRDPNLPPAPTQMWNLTVQHQLPSNWLVEIGYLGNRSYHSFLINNYNDARPVLPGEVSDPQTRRYVSSFFGNLPQLTGQGYSNYSALTMSINKRFSQGLSLDANYTWSRALGVAPPVTEGINGFNIENPLDLRREYGPLEFDVVNRVSISYIYELPFGKGKPFLKDASGALNQVVGGWQINGITTLQGGFPVTASLGYSLGNTFTNSRPDAIGDPYAGARQAPNHWLNAAAYTIPTAAQYAAGDYFGNAGTNTIREPGLVNFDFSIFKAFPIREGMNLQFRSEFFNLTNTPFYGLPGALGTTVGAPNFGVIGSAGDPRVIQLALKLLF